MEPQFKKYNLPSIVSFISGIFSLPVTFVIAKNLLFQMFTYKYPGCGLRLTSFSETFLTDPLTPWYFILFLLGIISSSLAIYARKQSRSIWSSLGLVLGIVALIVIIAVFVFLAFTHYQVSHLDCIPGNVY